ncbi:MAG: FAD-dependent oxidoreductase [Pseudomonadota bacterium]
MKVLVLGAGVVGLATAYYLWKDGHEVVVVDRQPGPGQASSYGNAGGLCPSFAGPWAAPGMVAKVLGMSLQADSPIRFSLMPNWQRLRWVMQWMQNCNAEKFRINKLRMQRVAHYSFACLKEISAEAPITGFDFCQGGVLQIFRTQAELDVGRLSAKALQEYGVAWKLLTADEVRRAEPALARTTVPIAGALQMPADGSGDSFKFANQLAAFLEARGVIFKYATPITAIHTEGDGVSGIMTAAGPLKADAYVVALGNGAPMLVAPLNYHKNIGKWLLLALVVLHIVAIVYYLLKKHKLVQAMLHGDKELISPVPPSRDDAASRAGALLVFAVSCGVVYWISSLAA